MEKEIKINETNIKGKIFYSINPKQDLDNGEYVVVEKMYMQSKMYKNKYGGEGYLTNVKYKDKQVSFFMNLKQKEVFDNIAGIGDKVKIKVVEKTYTNPRTKVKIMYKDYEFEKIN